MPVLHKAQEILDAYHWMYKNISQRNWIFQLAISTGCNFHSQFTLKPKGKYKIGVCMGTACYVKGSQAILNELAKELI